MAKVRLVSPAPQDLLYISQHLRDSDRLELFSVHGSDYDLGECLRQSVAISDEAQVAMTVYGEPFAVFGVAPTGLGSACPWLLGTDTMDCYGREIVSLSREHVAAWGLRYPSLFNFVDARNRRSIAWLKRTGFTLADAQPYGLKGELFHRFERCA